jgi:hypothetical protein
MSEFGTANLDTELPSPSELQSKKIALPLAQWEAAGQRKVIPHDLQEILGAGSDVLRMGHHAWQFVQPPLAGAELAGNGIDARSGQGKHYSARPYVDDLDRLLHRWRFQGLADPTRIPKEERRWQIVTQADNGTWIFIVIAEKRGQHSIYTVYPITEKRVELLISKGYIQKREDSRP